MAFRRPKYTDEQVAKAQQGIIDANKAMMEKLDEWNEKIKEQIGLVVIGNDDIKKYLRGLIREELDERK